MEAIAALLPSLPGHVPGRPGGGACRQKRSAGMVVALMRVATGADKNCHMVRVAGNRDATPGSTRTRRGRRAPPGFFVRGAGAACRLATLRKLIGTSRE
jgi:hypothetical protein